MTYFCVNFILKSKFNILNVFNYETHTLRLGFKKDIATQSQFWNFGRLPN